MDTLCNQLIHSYIFSLENDEDGVIGAIIFASDDHKDNCIYRIELEKFLIILKLIGYSDVVKVSLRRDSKKRSGFEITRQYGFDERMPKKGLPKTVIEYIKNSL